MSAYHGKDFANHYYVEVLAAVECEMNVPLVRIYAWRRVSIINFLKICISLVWITKNSLMDFATQNGIFKLYTDSFI